MDLFTGSPEALFDALSAASPDGFLISSADGRLLAANERLFELWELSAAEHAEVRRLGSTAAALEALQHAFQRHVVCGRSPSPAPASADVAEIALRDGRVLERHAAPTFGPDGAPTGWVVVFHDITRRKRNEDALEDRVKHEAALAALGELAMNT
jgi:PAS domain-containing protein